MAENEVDMKLGLWRRIYQRATRGRRINSVSWNAEALFWRIHCVCDDFGNFEAEPDLLRLDAVPMRRDVSADAIRRYRDDLVANELIRLYTCAGQVYGHVCGFTKLQPAGRNGKRVRRFPECPYESDDPDGSVNLGGVGGILGNPVIPGESGGALSILAEQKQEQEHKQEHQQKQKQEQCATAAAAAGSFAHLLPDELLPTLQAWVGMRYSGVDAEYAGERINRFGLQKFTHDLKKAFKRGVRGNWVYLDKMLEDPNSDGAGFRKKDPLARARAAREMHERHTGKKS